MTEPNGHANVLIETGDLWKTYQMGAEEIHALRGVSFQIHRGEYVVPSGGALVIREGDAGSGSAEVVALLAAILGQLQEGGGTILIDEERLKKAGFLHQSNFGQVYKR